MQISISVLNVEKSTGKSRSGSAYQVLEVAYKDLQKGDVKSKKLMSFTYPEVFKTFNDAKAGETYYVEIEKEGEYWQWTSVSREAPTASNKGLSNPKTTATAAPARNTYETPEERAAKQVYIVKQSSINAAIQALSIGAKTPPSTDSIIEVAQTLVDWVFEKKTVTIPEPSLDEMADDIPY